jgi:hypothetical protein
MSFVDPKNHQLESVERVPLDFIAPAIGSALLRKIAGFTGGRNEHSWSKQFFGLSEADAVFCIARILEAVGYDVYLECKAKHRDGRVDRGGSEKLDSGLSYSGIWSEYHDQTIEETA